jgi:7-cyano-7-deazaguanine synthase in queuosine biosynthesis
MFEREPTLIGESHARTKQLAYWKTKYPEIQFLPKRIKYMAFKKPDTEFVAARNLLFVCALHNVAHQVDATVALMGLHASSFYKDADPKEIVAYSKLTGRLSGTKLKLVCPLANYGKWSIYKALKRLRLPLAFWTCYKDSSALMHCGDCEHCRTLEMAVRMENESIGDLYTKIQAELNW